MARLTAYFNLVFNIVVPIYSKVALKVQKNDQYYASTVIWRIHLNDLTNVNFSVTDSLLNTFIILSSRFPNLCFYICSLNRKTNQRNIVCKPFCSKYLLKDTEKAVKIKKSNSLRSNNPWCLNSENLQS